MDAVKQKQLNKTSAFEYFVLKMYEWYESSESKKNNDLSTLKILKLLFFVSAVGTTASSTNTLLDDVFDSYSALPYGPVETEIYEFIKGGNSSNIFINNTSTAILNTESIIDSINPILKINIDRSIEMLKEINFNFVKKSAFDLVQISHGWYCWAKNFEIAQKEGNSSYPMPKDEIKDEIKIYY